MTAQPQYTWSEVATATQMGNATMSVFAAQSVPLTYAIANRTQLSANIVTRIGGLSGLTGSALFLLDQYFAAGVAFAAFLLLDCTDGALARLRNTVSPKGADLDLWTDRIVLFAAALSFSAAYLIDGHLLAAWLCLAYLATHYVTDLNWLVAERRRVDLPPELAAIRRRIERALPRPSARLPCWIRAVGRFERNVRPCPWVCNIAFLLGSCFILTQPESATGIALGALLWCIAATRASNFVRRVR